MCLISRVQLPGSDWVRAVGTEGGRGFDQSGITKDCDGFASVRGSQRGYSGSQPGRGAAGGWESCQPNVVPRFVKTPGSCLIFF